MYKKENKLYPFKKLSHRYSRKKRFKRNLFNHFKQTQNKVVSQSLAMNFFLLFNMIKLCHIREIPSFELK